MMMSLKQKKIKIVSQSIWWPASINWIRPCCMQSLVKSPCQSKFMFPVIPSVPLTLRQVLWLLFMHNIKYFCPLRLLQDYNCVQSCSNSCALCVMFHGALSTHRRAGKTDRRYAVFLCAHHHLTCMCTKLLWNSENKSRGLYFSKALFERLIFGGAYLRREICVSKSIGLSL